MILLRWRDRGWKKVISDDAAEFEMLPKKKEAEDVKAANLSLESVNSEGEIDIEKDEVDIEKEGGKDEKNGSELKKEKSMVKEISVNTNKLI